MKKQLIMLVLALSSAVWAGDLEDGKAVNQGNADAQYELGIKRSARGCDSERACGTLKRGSLNMDQTVHALNPWLIAGAMESAVAGLLHVGCIVFGASWYRLLGAGEDMARMVEAGRLQPHLITLVVALILFGWATYALAGAGQLLPLLLPAIRWVILAITLVYLLRGIAGFFINTSNYGRSHAFWWWSSSICLAIGAMHAVGLWQVWHRL